MQIMRIWRQNYEDYFKQHNNLQKNCRFFNTNDVKS